MFRERFKENRIRLDMSIEDISEILGVDQDTISRWETGMSLPDLDTVIKLSELFNVSIDYLLKDRKSDSDFSYYTVVKEEEKKYLSVYKLLSISTFILSILTILTFLVIAVVEPVVYVDPGSGISYTGLRAYCMTYKDVTVVVLLAIIAFVFSALYLLLPEEKIFKLFQKKL